MGSTSTPQKKRLRPDDHVENLGKSMGKKPPSARSSSRRMAATSPSVAIPIPPTVPSPDANTAASSPDTNPNTAPPGIPRRNPTTFTAIETSLDILARHALALHCDSDNKILYEDSDNLIRVTADEERGAKRKKRSGRKWGSDLRKDDLGDEETDGLVPVSRGAVSMPQGVKGVNGQPTVRNCRKRPEIRTPSNAGVALGEERAAGNTVPRSAVQQPIDQQNNVFSLISVSGDNDEAITPSLAKQSFPDTLPSTGRTTQRLRDQRQLCERVIQSTLRWYHRVPRITTPCLVQPLATRYYPVLFSILQRNSPHSRDVRKVRLRGHPAGTVPLPVQRKRNGRAKDKEQQENTVVLSALENARYSELHPVWEACDKCAPFGWRCLVEKVFRKRWACMLCRSACRVATIEKRAHTEWHEGMAAISKSSKVIAPLTIFGSEGEESGIVSLRVDGHELTGSIKDKEGGDQAKDLSQVRLRSMLWHDTMARITFRFPRNECFITPLGSELSS